MNTKSLITFLVLVSATEVQAQEKTDEEIFSQANYYTVKIKTNISIPINNDEKGLYEGAGILIDIERGWVLSNAHVISRSPSTNEVAFRDTEYNPAEKYYIDHYTDVAILKVPKDSIPSTAKEAPLGCDVSLGTGHAVGAFGHPYGHSYTATRGIISGKTTKHGPEYLQTDAPISPGNSGGPLISLISGKIIGLNTSSIDEEDAQNINFAVPIGQVCRIIQLLALGKDPSSPSLLNVLFFKQPDDKKILKVARTFHSKGEPELKAGDVIEKVGDEITVITNKSDLIHALRGNLSQIKLHVKRNEEVHTLSGQYLPMEPISGNEGLYISGIYISPYNVRDLNINGLLMIHYVDPVSKAATDEIAASDFIYKIDGKTITDVKELNDYLSEIEPLKNNVSLTLKRFTSAEDVLYEYLEKELEIKDRKIIKLDSR